MNILFLRGFNNYFNRTVKKYSALADYQSNSTAYVNFESINFNPNDGVVTELILGNESQKENNLPLDWENVGTPDYCVCYENVGSPAVATIRSRWFVLESERLRTGQYRLALKRDVVAEHFNHIKKAPCFIEKGMINDVSNPLLYNKESMTYNQIKTAEYPLKDATDCGWIVGYIAKNKPDSATTVTTTIVREGDPGVYYDYDDLPFNVNPSSPQVYKTLDTTQDIITVVPVASASKTWNVMQYWMILKYKSGTSVNITRNSTYAGTTATTPPIGAGAVASYYVAANTNSVQAATQFIGNGPSTVADALTTTGYYNVKAPSSTFRSNAYLPFTVGSTNADNNHYISFYDTTAYPSGYLGDASYASMTPFNNSTHIQGKNTKTFVDTAISHISGYTNVDILSYNGKIVKYSDNKFYQINISANLYSYENLGKLNVTSINEYSDRSITQTSTQYNDLNTAYRNLLTNMGYYTRYTMYNNATNYCTIIPVVRYVVTLSLVATETLSLTIPSKDNRAHTFDNSADLFAIPYGEIDLSDDGVDFVTSSYRSLAMGRAIAQALGDNVCYDLQLVPYCPSQILVGILEWYVRYGEPYDVTGLESNTYNVFYDGSSLPVGVVFWCTESKGTFDIEMSMNPFVGEGSPALINKLTNETQVCRIASPNFNGQFEFSLAKNNGVTKFNVDYTYKPYSPYIHVNPDFKFMYGRDWDDARGLICGGDFSLAFISDYWQTYMNNNKNFQQIFDRQIQNMDVNNAIALEKQEFQATVGTITSAIGGALGGGVAGASAGAAAGPWGALAGGIIGAIGGGVGSGMASAYGAEKDRDWLLRQQQESRSYAIDMYGYQLGNIQAMPYSIKGTDALTNNNKIWPIVEIYNATDSEVELLKAKIQYNGMTVMAVGKIEDYYSSGDFDKVFVKGQLIKLDGLNDINDDFHIADAIYQEINKGVYIPSGGL